MRCFFSFLKNTDPDIECFMGVILGAACVFTRFPHRIKQYAITHTFDFLPLKDSAVNKDKVKGIAKILFCLTEDKQNK